jgi:hypothetical protein
MKKDDRGPPTADAVSPPNNSPLSTLNPLGLTLNPIGPSFPGVLASKETVEAYNRRREEVEILRRAREEQEARNPPPAPNDKPLSLLGMMSDSFEAGRQEGRREARLARELMVEEEAARAADKPSDKPHPQTERDRDEILGLMRMRGLTLRAAGKELQNRWKNEGVISKTRSNRLYEAKRLIGATVVTGDL